MDYSKLHALANKMGCGEVLSFDKMYNGGTINAYGKKDASFTFFTIRLNSDNKIVGIDFNTTYLKTPKKVIEFNKICDFENPLTIEDSVKHFIN